MNSAVARQLAKQVISLYRELLTDRKFQLVLRSESPLEPRKDLKLTLDLSRLPRGRLDPSLVPAGAELRFTSAEGSWHIQEQLLPLHRRRLLS